MGRCVKVDTASETIVEQENKHFYDLFRNYNWEIFYLLREILWQLAKIESKSLADFIRQVSPDVVMAPLCYSRYVLAVQRFAIKTAAVPAVTYVYDDLYSFQQLRFSPIYWLNRVLLRGALRKTMPYYRLAYTMTEQQAREYEKYFRIPLKILRKGANPLPHVAIGKRGIRLIYAGGIYYGRDRTLAKVADAVRALQTQNFDVELHIYTNSPLKKKMMVWLNDGTASFIHPAVPAEELKSIYAQSDIALHVESFQKKNALLTRLSFSTKIVDCLASGCAVMAICPSSNAGWQYLREEDAALCVSQIKQIVPAVETLVRNVGLRQALARKAALCLKRNHNPAIIRQELYHNLLSLAKEE